MKCPSCHAEEQTGKFCAECGAPLDAACPSCGAAFAPDSRFCTQCGEALGGARAGGPEGARAKVGWIIGGAAAMVVLLVLFLPRQADRVTAPPLDDRTPAGAPSSGPAGGMPPLSADMRTNADRLFNRVMRAAEEGDRAEAERFMPMAVEAYRLVEELDDDGLYHLALLRLTGNQPEEARRTAETILDRTPEHLLGLGVAAEAAEEAGDSAEARSLRARFVEAYPQEMEDPLPEYAHHGAVIEEYLGTAREATDGP